MSVHHVNDRLIGADGPYDPPSAIGRGLDEATRRAMVAGRRSSLLSGRAYYVVGIDGNEYSADAADYWSAPDSAPVGALARRQHPWRTVTGRRVWAPHLIKFSATVGDLRRLAAAADRMAER